METIDHRAARVTETLGGPDENAQYWRCGRHGGLECLAARFSRHRYALHTHDTYVIGTVLDGCETYMLNGVCRYARPGDLCFVHPGDVHDGEPYQDRFVYRMSYPSADLLCEIASEIADRPVRGAPAFAEPVLSDPDGARAFAHAHRLLGEGERLAGDEMLLGVLARFLTRYAPVSVAGLGRETGPVRCARDYLAAHLAEDVDLATLAGIAGLSRFHLIRAFRRETGLTPFAWLADRRVREARALLAGGASPGEAAAACGFADQSHLTRAFKARIGVTPGRYRAACGFHAT